MPTIRRRSHSSTIFCLLALFKELSQFEYYVSEKFLDFQPHAFTSLLHLALVSLLLSNACSKDKASLLQRLD